MRERRVNMKNNDMKKLILASASPRRSELMKQAGFDFSVIVSDTTEKFEDGLSPDSLVESLAKQKAMAVADKIEKDALIIGADTLVVLGDAVLGKPKDEYDAKRMIGLLQGNTHFVYTGLCVIEKKTGRSILHAEKTAVRFSDMTEKEIDAYVSSGESLDKAGAYGIQGSCAIHIDRIEGCYFNVMGLPLNALYKILKQFS